jgi:hypothetical protein
MFDFHLENTTLSMLFQAKYLHRFVITAQREKIQWMVISQHGNSTFFDTIFLRKKGRKMIAGGWLIAPGA